MAVLIAVLFLSVSNILTEADISTNLLRNLNTKIDSVKFILELDINLLKNDVETLKSRSFQTTESRSRVQYPEEIRQELEVEREKRKIIEKKYLHLEQRVNAILRGFGTQKEATLTVLNEAEQRMDHISGQVSNNANSLQKMTEMLTALNTGLVTEIRECSDNIEAMQDNFDSLKTEMDILKAETLQQIRTSVEAVNTSLQEYVDTSSRILPSTEWASRLMAKLPAISTWLHRTYGMNGTGKSCNDTEECWVRNSECRENMCSCRLGYSFDPGMWICVTTCDRYGNSFQKMPGRYLSGFTEARFSEVTLEECSGYCLSATLFECKSFNYFDGSRNCYLKSQTWLDTTVSRNRHHSSIYATHYQRDCE